MGHWNHRVLVDTHEGEEFFQIHEVYYNKDGIPDGYTQNAVTCFSEEGLEVLKWQLEMMQKCLEKPILWAGDSFPEEYSAKKE